MALMKRIKISPGTDSSELLESIPFVSSSEEETALSACKSMLAQMLCHDERPRLEWKGYLFSAEADKCDVYEPAAFMITNKRLLTAQWCEDHIEAKRLPMSGCLGYFVHNADGYVLPEFDINFERCSVSFLCRRDDAVGLEPELCRELHTARYQFA